MRFSSNSWTLQVTSKSFAVMRNMCLFLFHAMAKIMTFLLYEVNQWRRSDFFRGWSNILLPLIEGWFLLHGKAMEMEIEWNNTRAKIAPNYDTTEIGIVITTWYLNEIFAQVQWWISLQFCNGDDTAKMRCRIPTAYIHICRVPSGWCLSKF